MTTLIESAVLAYLAVSIIPSYYCSNSFVNQIHPDNTGPFSLDGRLFQNDYAIEAAKVLAHSTIHFPRLAQQLLEFVVMMELFLLPRS